MAQLGKPTTTVSTKGQVILPKAVRQRLNWDTGTRLTVEDIVDGVILKATPVFSPTQPKEVFKSLPFSGKAKTIEEMNAGILAEARRHHDRD